MRIPNAHLDARAPYRDAHAPDKLTVKKVPVQSPMLTITEAVNTKPMPAVIVTAGGKVWQMTSGGSGVVWVQTDTGRFSADQRDALDDITAAFEAEFPHLAKTAPKMMTGVVAPVVPSEPLGSVVEASGEPVAPVKKRKPRKKAAPKPESEIPFGD
jgi:hypothetical protein